MKSLFLLLFGIAAPVIAAPPEAYENVRASYEKKQQSLDESVRDALADAADAYRTQLDDLRGMYQKRGDLDGIVRVDAEKARFARFKRLAKADLVDSDAALRKVQVDFGKSDQRIRSGYGEAKRRLLEQFAFALETLRKKLTREDRLEDAKFVRAEEKRLQGLLGSEELSVVPPKQTPTEELEKAIMVYDRKLKQGMNWSEARAFFLEKGDRNDSHYFAELQGQKNVMKLHPHSPKKPCAVDFSAITGKGKGTLKLYVRNIYGDFNFRLRVNKVKIRDEVIKLPNREWQKFVVPFDHQPVIAEGWGGGTGEKQQWYFEWMVLGYELELE